jgi:SAM-dependent methyltransferase
MNKSTSKARRGIKQRNKCRRLYGGIIKAKVESLASANRSSILDWFDEEQGVLLEVAEKHVMRALRCSDGDVAIDPGCGSGILSLALAKKYETAFRSKINKIYAIDINPRAIEFSRDNSRINRLSGLYEFVNETYTVDSAPASRAAIILHNPPYHPTPTSSKGKLHVSCEGGASGQQVLKTFLAVSSKHLAKNGMICGIVNCRGNKMPEFFDYIRKWYKHDSIYWYPLHAPCSTYGFLEYINRWKRPTWAKGIARCHPLNHAGVYVIVRDGRNITRTKRYKFRYATPDWQFRWDAHRIIQDNEERQLDDPG